MAEAAATLRRHLGAPVPFLADTWSRSRLRAPYQRDALWRLGYGADTLETATTWANVPDLLGRLETAVASALVGRDERVMAFTHLSHVYPSGSSLYLTFLFRLAADPDETLERWLAIKRAASEAILAGEGTITHHHGVGVVHAPYLAAEKGELGMAALRALARTFDPDGMMNPGVLLAEAGP
jgi:alkyldihydroxyacetonephosphate synthase